MFETCHIPLVSMKRNIGMDAAILLQSIACHIYFRIRSKRQGGDGRSRCLLVYNDIGQNLAVGCNYGSAGIVCRRLEREDGEVARLSGPAQANKRPN